LKRFIILLLALFLLPIPSFAQVSLVQTVDKALPSDILSPVPQAGEFVYTPRPITAIVIHHSGSFPASWQTNAEAIEGYRNYHKYSVHPGVYADRSTWAWHQDSDGTWYQMPAQEGFPDGYSGTNGYNINDIDYHWLVGTDGLIYAGRPENTVGWHASNWEINLRSLGICFVGCFDWQAPSDIQYWAGVDLVSKKMIQYHITELYRHSDFANKSCPGYSFPWWQFVSDCRRWAGLYYDFDYDHWAHDYVAVLGQKNIVYGYPDGYFYPNKPITRAEFIYMLWKASGSPASTSTFPDTQSHWARQAIGWAIDNKLINGLPDGNFYPDWPVTRAAMAKITYNYKPTFANRYYADVGFLHWAFGYITANAYMTGYSDGTFRPDNPTTRAEACAVIARIIND